jgi:hypothetical protein
MVDAKTIIVLVKLSSDLNQRKNLQLYFKKRKESNFSTLFQKSRNQTKKFILEHEPLHYI